jgi:hypothetical protein
VASKGPTAIFSAASESMLRRLKGPRVTFEGALAISFLIASLAVAGCSSTVGFDDPTADYLQRTALVSTSGGDAQAANIAMQTATPWPRYSNDTNIPTNGARIVKVINRYESGSAGGGASDSATPSAASPGGNASSGPTTGASTGMTASPPGQSSGY